MARQGRRRRTEKRWPNSTVEQVGKRTVWICCESVSLDNKECEVDTYVPLECGSSHGRGAEGTHCRRTYTEHPDASKKIRNEEKKEGEERRGGGKLRC